jgi:hypothetical protein
MANTVTLLSYANTFGDWVVTTNNLVKENNDLAANNYVKSTGTLYLNNPTLGLSVANTSFFQGKLTAASAQVLGNLTVDTQVYFSNTVLGLTNAGQANINGLLLAQGPDTGLYVSNNATIGGTLSVAGLETVGSSLTVNGAVILGNTLTVASNALFSSNVNASEYVNVTRDVSAVNFKSSGTVSSYGLNITGSGNISGQLSVGGNFVINGSTVYSTNTFTLNAGSGVGLTSFYSVYRGSSANAAIRWNEPAQYFDIRDVNNPTSYSKILTANLISDSLTTVNSSTLASSAAANTLYTYLIANTAYLQSQINSNSSNSQSQLASNVASLQSQINANTIYFQGIDDTQNTNITNLNTYLNNSLNALQNQLNANTLSLQNQISGNTVYFQGIDNAQNTSITNLNTNLSSSVTSLQNQINSNTAFSQGVNNSQNTSITNVNTFAQSAFNIANGAYSTANSAVGSAAAAYNQANTATTSAASKVASITGTTNQITVSGTTTPTLSLPQSIATSSSVQFGSFGVGTAASGTSGEVRATNNITAYYSDDRLKTRLGNIENALDKLMSLNGFHYEANQTAQDLGYKVKPEVGLSAQEVQAILPEVVVPAPIDEKYLTIHYERVIPLLVEAIKELKREVDSLKK